MASRVNVKFVVILSVILTLVFGGVATVGLMVVLKSGDDLVRMGDAKVQAGDALDASGNSAAAQEEYKSAEFLYSKAVAKDRSSVDYLDRWTAVLEKWIPETQTLYRSAFDRSMAIRRQKAILLRTDLGAHNAYLSMLERQIVLGELSRAALDYLISETASALQYMDGDTGDTLRRYRGRAIVEILEANLDITDAQRELAKADLEAALRADPTDGTAAISLSRWYRSESRRAAADSRAADAAQLAEQSIETIRQFAAANPTDATGALGLLQIEVESALNASGANSADTARLAPRVREVADMILTQDPAKLDIIQIARLRLIETIVMPESSGSITSEVIGRAIEANPEDPDLLALRARISFESRDYASAIEQYQQIRDLKPQPVSLKGMRRFLRRVEAVSQQAECALGMWEQAKTAEEKAALIDRATKYRASLATELPTDAPALLLLDAKIALAQGRDGDAQKLLLQYNERTLNNDIQGVWLLGQVTMRTQPGVARRQFERVLQLQPNNIAAMVALGTMEAQLQNHEHAIEIFRQALAVSPDNEGAKRALEASLIATNQKASDDPVIQLVIDARRTEQGSSDTPGDRAGAIASLNEGLTPNGMDLRIVVELLRLYLEENDLKSAQRLIANARVEHPDEAWLVSIEGGLKSGDLLEVGKSMIDSSSMPPAEKLVATFRLYKSRGKTTEAIAFLEEARRLSPQDAQVLDLLFSEMLEAGNLERAQSLAQEATRIDADRVGGLTYRARIEIFQNRTADAVRTLQQAVNSGGASVGVNRLLGRQLVTLGRNQEGFASYRRALEMRPDDIATINEFIAMLVRANDLTQALQVARDSEKYGRVNPVFQNLWIDLEAAVGDKQLALTRRIKQVELNPDDRENRLALASIYIEMANWAEARKVIDALRAEEVTLKLVELDAKWYADQNDVDGARGAFVNYITEQDPTTLTSEPYLVFGQFMLGRRFDDVGLAALAQARTRQDPKVLEADKQLADASFRLGRHEEALQLYKGILDAGADLPDQTYRLRYIEALLRTQKWPEAEQEITKLGERANTDAVLLMLRADAAKGVGDMRRCRELLDRAVEVSPEDPFVYVERAQARALDPLLVGQAMQDLDRALQLRPSFWQALRLRASLRAQQGDIESALADLRAAVTSNPALNELRYGLMLELLNRGRSTEAAEVAEQGLSQRPGDLMLMLGTGQIFAERKLWPRSASFYRRAWAQAQDNATAQLYIESLLNMSPPDLNEATNVLNRMGERVQTDPSLLLARAEILAKRNRIDDARRELTASYSNVRGDPRLIMAWYAGARRVLTKNEDFAAYLELLERELPDPWVTYMRGRTLSESLATLSSGVELLRRVQNINNVTLGVNAYRTEGTAYYTFEQYDQALAAWQRGLAKYADDWEINNNVAFVLAKHLGRPDEAIPFAEAAAKINPNLAEIQDTLGVALTLTKQFDRADAALQKAMGLSRAGSESQVTIMVHQGLLDYARGEIEAARARAKSADDLLRAMPSERPSIRAEVDDLLRLVP